MQVLKFEFQKFRILEILNFHPCFLFYVQEIFDREQMQNTMVTWGVRFGGWLLMFIAFSCLTSIINTLGKSEYVYSFLLKKLCSVAQLVEH